MVAQLYVNPVFIYQILLHMSVREMIFCLNLISDSNPISSKQCTLQQVDVCLLWLKLDLIS